MTEILDNNKSALTHRITGVAMGYLHGAGFKPIETEVPVAPGWIADVASFIYPTETEAKKMKLNRRFDGAENVEDRQWYSGLLYRYSFPLTAIVEIKIAKSDFTKDLARKFLASPPAHLAYLAYPAGMIADHEIPRGWFGLKCSMDGSKLVRVISMVWHIHSQAPGDIADFIAQVAIRRHHRTAYEEMRHMLKSWRAREKGDNANTRSADIIRAITRYLSNGGHCNSLKAELKYLDIACPDWLDKDMAILEGLKVKS